MLNYLQFYLPLAMIVLAFFTGRWIDYHHIKSLKKKESELSDMLLTNLKCFPDGAEPVAGGLMVTGHVVIANDYLKATLATMRKFFGGEIRSYQLLLERARREAIVRMLTQARMSGYDAVCNLRINFCNIGSIGGIGKILTVEVLACGTAYSRTAMDSE